MFIALAALTIAADVDSDFLTGDDYDMGGGGGDGYGDYVGGGGGEGAYE